MRIDRQAGGLDLLGWDARRAQHRDHRGELAVVGVERGGGALAGGDHPHGDRHYLGRGSHLAGALHPQDGLVRGDGGTRHFGLRRQRSGNPQHQGGQAKQSHSHHEHSSLLDLYFGLLPRTLGLRLARLGMRNQKIDDLPGDVLLGRLLDPFQPG